MGYDNGNYLRSYMSSECYLKYISNTKSNKGVDTTSATILFHVNILLVFSFIYHPTCLK